MIKLVQNYVMHTLYKCPQRPFAISKNIISFGEPLIVEKPISLSKSDVKNLVDLSNKKKVF